MNILNYDIHQLAEKIDLIHCDTILLSMKGNFSTLVQADQLVLVDFYADWCGPCKMLAPILKEVKTAMGDTVKIIKIDVDKNPVLAQEYQVRGVPTLMLFRNGQQLWRQSGVLQKSALIEVLESFQH
ncbi:thioredoxin [Flagellimonas meishanensis]|uniref:thioredoxin n=1 Tax=Flagellimonas meishanensis TaxID=2873264 RepID=UPI003AB04D03